MLKSPPYGDPTRRGPLPYRIDLLAPHGFTPSWTDDRRGAQTDAVVRRIEGLVVPVTQAWRGRRLRRDAVATVAMFESEAHGLALWRALTRRTDPPLVVIACWLTDVAAASRWRRSLYRLLYGTVDAVIVFSDNQRVQLAESLHVPIERITAVRFGIDLDELNDICSRPRLEDGDDLTVVAVGRDLGRDWSTFADAVRDTGWNVELVTRAMQVDGIELPREVRHRHRLERDEYLRLLATAAVVVVPTHVRAYPSGQTVLLEAMALGRACVVTDTPAMREYVVDGETALLVPPHDATALRVAIERVIGDASLGERLGAAARTAELGHGGAVAMWANVADTLDDVIDDVHA